MRGRVLGALVGLLGIAGCTNLGYFVCSTDADCTEAQGGRCEPSGACSVPDTMCPTGRRYGELGNPTLAGTCVPADDIASSGVDPTLATGSEASGTSMTADGLSSTGGGVSSTASPGVTGVTGDDDSGSSSAADPSTGGMVTTDASSSSTGDGVPADMWSDCMSAAECSELCAPVVDILSLDPLGHWCTGFDCSDPVLDCIDPGTGATPDCVPLEFDGDVASRCLLDCSETGTAGCPDGMECFEVFMSPSRCAHPVAR